MPPKKLKVNMTALCLKHEALCREATRPVEEKIATEETRHQAKMARLHIAKSKAYNKQEANNKKELTAMEVDDADIMRTCPACCTSQEGDFEECKCGKMLGCLDCAASTQIECGTCEVRGCEECMEAPSCGGCNRRDPDEVYCEECLDHNC
jgi:hypothetical protein